MSHTTEKANTIFKLSPKAEKLKNQFLSPFAMKFFLLAKLPLAFMAKLRIVKLDDHVCAVTLPYGWRTQNPFQSIYFAAQAMAAELSTGTPALLAIENSGAKVSMLVVDMKAEFVKKGTSLTTFVCEDVQGFMEAVNRSVETGESVTFTAKSTGTMADGTVVSNFSFTWSFKAKKK
jgi:hypothetical protein